ncbi:DUF3073 domain-containing protein [Pseudoclavibacter caeni]|jgi:hypothetical protein|uniref:DUF3073 domain-containing protein n=1 Tax=Pseudoclavibacter caeni TaxID=908846 RepID=A0A7C8FXL0_9MICO|nr:DUF3073 domain-containing protein [Pseudoclavibacter caeni]KAB1631537.1 DUF3073 domain-containing protein [Pseudoclavibacter caeni]NYJ97870.1 hypothetical protein [Pseudoclavibacter caeni]
MGRGRQKAKHTKVARQLKYNVPATDYEALERELRSSAHHDESAEEDWNAYHYPAEDDREDDER